MAWNRTRNTKARVRALALPEHRIQSQFVRELHEWGRGEFLAWSVPNERPMSDEPTGEEIGHLRKLRRMGLMPGAPDLVVIWLPRATVPGVPMIAQPRICLLEFKSAAGRLSEVQEAAHAQFRSFGVPVHVVRSPQEAWDALAREGAPVRIMLAGAG